MLYRNKAFLPLLLSVTLLLGVYAGIYLSANTDTDQINFIAPPSTRTMGSKLNQIISYIEDEYVDTVKKDRLVEKAINSLLAELDPHSYYIPPEELSDYTEPLEGNFEGIGIEFVLEKDTIVVVNTINGGPSETAGLHAGDRIFKINGRNVGGVGIANDEVMKYLRGLSGTKVNLDVIRHGAKKPLRFTITRGKIPIKSIDAALLLNDSTGFIKVSRFAKTTYQEFIAAVDMLNSQSSRLRKLVVDLRGNGGGYLTSAIQITEEFLAKDKLIVYTQGKAQPTRRYYSSKNGLLRHLKLDVLINESSASASEIMAGAIQDNDRGTIIGRRSFGKGLVQEQMDLPDKSAVRLTVARYYTPTGRCIQKPYGHGINYDDDFSNRMATGELIHADSVKVVDSLKFKTPKGKIVYGGGGIIPDVFVPIDSSSLSLVLGSLLYGGQMSEYAFTYTDLNRQMLMAYKTPSKFEKQFSVSQKIYQLMLSKAMGKEVTRYIKPKEEKEIKLRLKALIARNIWGNEGYYRVLLPTDEMVVKLLSK